MKISAQKLKMTQIWKEGEAIAVSPLKLRDSSHVALFNEGDTVKVTGTTKGRGFQGVVKRHSFAGGPKTHGQKNRHRAPGSIGNTAAQRVIPGRKMAGRMGGAQKTIRGISVAAIDKENALLMVKGSVPGTIRGTLSITKIS